MPPTARIAFRGPDHLTVVPVLEELELFRVVSVDRPHHPGLAVDLASNYERGARPRAACVVDVETVWRGYPEPTDGRP